MRACRVALGSVARQESRAKKTAVKKRLPPRGTRFAGDGCRKMRSNSAERAIRPIAPGGKNLFAGSGARGRRAAIVSTLVETAKLNCKSLNLSFQSLREKSQRAIHLLAASLANGSILSRTRANRASFRTPYGILDRIDSVSPIMAAVG
jgi:hypothetical protein